MNVALTTDIGTPIVKNKMDEKLQSRGRVVCVYCASSRTCHPDFHAAAFKLGELLAEQDYSIVYGGGAVGSMGALADGALSKQGRVVGVIPNFMVELEWEHPGITELHRVEDMRTRKHIMLSQSQAVVAFRPDRDPRKPRRGSRGGRLPSGCHGSSWLWRV